MQSMQNDIEYYKGHLRHLQTLNDCLRKDLDELRRQNSTLKWKKCDLEREISRLHSTAECLRQRVSFRMKTVITTTTVIFRVGKLAISGDDRGCYFVFVPADFRCGSTI